MNKRFSIKPIWILVPMIVAFISVGVYHTEQRKKILAKEGILTLADITEKKVKFRRNDVV